MKDDYYDRKHSEAERGRELADAMRNPKFITVVYRVEDKSAFAKTNPLDYHHDGCRAVACAMGDELTRLEQIENQGLPDPVKEALNSGDGTYHP